jgi:hypothetical protein
MPWPSGMPPWEETELTKLSAAGSLAGLNPLVLAGIGQNESGWEVKGAGINAEGYGGYYGLGEHSTYSYQGQSITITPSIDDTNSLASFDTQSEAAALEVQSLLAGTGGDLDKALSEYVSGGPNDLGNADYTDAAAALGINPATGGNTGGPISSGGAGGTQATLADTGPVAKPTLKLEGLAGFLQQFDQVLNPSGPGGITGFLTGGTIQAVETIAIRGMFTIAFMALGYLGVKILTGGKSGGTSVIDIVQRSQSNAVHAQNAATNARNAETRAAPPVSKRETSHTSTRVNRREGGFNNESTVTHIKVPAPEQAKPSGAGRKVSEAATAVAEGALLA